jgi:hypothetical protein
MGGTIRGRAYGWTADRRTGNEGYLKSRGVPLIELDTGDGVRSAILPVCVSNIEFRLTETLVQIGGNIDLYETFQYLYHAVCTFYLPQYAALQDT